MTNMSEETYTAPPHGWTCFHCGETFLTVGTARDHFGADQSAMPGCMERVNLGPERGLLMALRRAQHRIALYMEEDTDLHRAMAALQRGHSDALRMAEEAGYERGLRDAKLEASNAQGQRPGDGSAAPQSWTPETK